MYNITQLSQPTMNNKLPSHTEETPKTPAKPAESAIGREGMETRGNSAISRRAVLAGLFGLAVTTLVPGNADAQEYGTHPDPYAEHFAVPLGIKTIPEKLTPAEIPLMKEGLKVIQKQFLQPSFFLNAAPLGLEDEVKKAMLAVYTNPEKLYYEAGEYGKITIKKRPNIAGFDEDFEIIIYNGYITSVNGEEINTKALKDWEEEWARIQDRIETINRKIRDRTIPKTDKDNQWFEYYSLQLPRQYMKLLEAKEAGGRLNKEEKKVYKRLKKELKDHPRTLEEMEGDMENGIEPKIGWFYTTRGIELPKNMIELVYAGWQDKAWQTFAYLHLDGRVMKNTTPRQDTPTLIPSK